MEAENNGTASAIMYTECDWGDAIAGSKEQLQALGLGVGMAFPGEVAGPRRVLHVRDPRGYPSKIYIGYGDHAFIACVRFPHLPIRPGSERRVLTIKNLRKFEYCWFDEYTGTANDLVSAGLVRLDQLPGKPGMRKVRVRIFPDGTLPAGPRTNNHAENHMPGARCIERASLSTYRISIVVSEDEKERRRTAGAVAEDAWVREVRALPRPARLQPIGHGKLTGWAPSVGPAATSRAATRPGTHLRLVWSAPLLMER